MSVVIGKLESELKMRVILPKKGRFTDVLTDIFIVCSKFYRKGALNQNKVKTVIRTQHYSG